LVLGGEPEIIRENSGESNGMTFDAQGRVVVCEMINRQVTRMEADGSFTVLADR
jgi:gluconolactonase